MSIDRSPKHRARDFTSRRELLHRAGEGIGSLALAWLLNQDGLLGAPGTPAGLATGACANSPGMVSPFSPKKPHFEPRAKAVISLFMDGGVSHLDTFDPKPALDKYHGQPLPVKGEVQVQQAFRGPLCGVHTSSSSTASQELPCPNCFRTWRSA